jgi:hypothetical protein
MTTVEEKLDFLLKEMKAVQANQLKVTTGGRSHLVEQGRRHIGDRTTPRHPRSQVAHEAAGVHLVGSAAQGPAARGRGAGKGHRVESSYQGADGGALDPHPTLVTGETRKPQSFHHFDVPESSNRKVHYGAVPYVVNVDQDDRKYSAYHNSPKEFAPYHQPKDYKLPKLNCPVFTGEHPRVWRDKCEKYFAMFQVPIHLWAPYATINFKGTAELWLQTYEAHHAIDSWPDLCYAVEQKFGRDLYQNYMKDLLSIRQTTDVLEYADRFEQARHHVLVHNKGIDEVFFVQKFLDGLNFNISNALQLHKPRTVDVALSLALMQEQVLEAAGKRYPSKTRDFKQPPRAYPTPVHQSPGAGVLGTAPTSDKGAGKPKWDDKVAALRAARRAKGLCMKCGEQYSPQHRCPNQIQFHVLEEWLNAMDSSDTDSDTSDKGAGDGAEEILSLSVAAIEGVQGKKTMRLQGLIQHQEVLILVDSGSSSTFIRAELVQELGLVTTKTKPAIITVADGGQLQCDSMVEGHTFVSDAKVLSIKYYDIILGADWLEQHSPMWVHWKKRKMRFTHKGHRITLRGVADCTSSCLKLKSRKLRGLLKHGGVSHMVQLNRVSTKQPTLIPAEVQHLVSEYESIFQKPTSLPPARQFDHHISLVPGVQPVNIKPYRYSPLQKDEIERQVAEMLSNGVIQPSVSPFASPVLLVKKKDGSWRFYIDFRQLNAITIKNKYPLPIVDELLDELHGAKYFTKLDMSSGYHQIRLAPEDEHNTAFKTHHGHWNSG